MFRKSIIIFLGFFFLIGGTFVSAKKFDLDYFFNQPDTVLSPVYPWYSERPKDPYNFLKSESTPFRTKWQKEPFAPYYRFSTNFKRTDYERWRNFDLRGFKIIDEEDTSGEYCRYRDSIIGNKFLTDIEIAGRCCVCGIGGEWQCQYSHVKASRQCQSTDLLLTSVDIVEDLSFTSLGQDKFTFSAIVKNDSAVTSNDFIVSILLNDVEISSNTFTGLSENQQITLSESLFPFIETGIIIDAGEHTLKISVQEQESEEGNIQNNEYSETVTVLMPQNDFLIYSVNIIQTGDTNIEGQEELAFEVMIKNDGEYFAIAPDSYVIELLTDPEFPPFYTEQVDEYLIPGDSLLSEFSIYGDPGAYTFFVKVIPNTEEEENLLNNISEIPFTVY